jgi:hypothetical protein
MRADQHRCQIGRGEMRRVWRGRAWTLPFLLLGAHRRVLFPAQGRDVPFTVSNYIYVDHIPLDVLPVRTERRT